jgi:competence protein ComEC
MVTPMKRLLLTLFLIASSAGVLPPSVSARTTLDIITIDVEGGKSLLIVSPSGESLLFDVGWPRAANRDASTEQIVDAIRAAGLKQIDYLVISHFDVDHMGDVPALATRIPIRHLIDHGEIQFPAAAAPNPSARDRFNAYVAFRRTIDHRVLKAGDRIPLKDVRIDVVVAGGQQISKPLAGGGIVNSLCATHAQAPVIERDVEDNQSIGLLLTYGRFRFLDLADLEAHHSHDLVCPANLVGHVDAYHVNVHGQFKGMAPELVGALRPAVAIMGNGARKGGDPETWPLLRATPGLVDVWQMHYSELGSADTNPPSEFIANLQGTSDEHYVIKLSVGDDGRYSVTNTRNGLTKTY